mgnify:CR=1 FL=1
MKKIALFAMLAALSGSAISGTIAPTTTGSQATVTTGDCSFLQTDMTMQVSANVGMAYICSTTAAAVQAGSIKGKYVYGGSTNGGGVQRCNNDEVSTSTGYKTTISSADGDGCS